MMQHAQALSALYAAAEAVVASIPERPVTSSYLAVGSTPGLESLRATITGLLGTLAITEASDISILSLATERGARNAPIYPVFADSVSEICPIRTSSTYHPAAAAPAPSPSPRPSRPLT